MAKQLGFFVDVQKCVSCFSCAMACKNQYHQEPEIIWRNVHPAPEGAFEHTERAHYSLACHHCERPACMEACPADAISKRPDGIVYLHADKCVGAGECVERCPYKAPKWNAKIDKAEKCNFCAERLDDGRAPACVQGCPTGALRHGEIPSASGSEWVRFPPGFQKVEALNPSIRFRMPKAPRVVGKT